MRELIAEQAAEWLIENRSGLDAAQRAAFSAWLKLSPLHIEEYLAIAALSRDLPAASEPRDESVEQLIMHARQELPSSVHRLEARPGFVDERRRRWQIPAATAALVSLLAIGLLSLGRWGLPRHTADRGAVTAQRFKTRHGEQATYVLTDHSVMHLNTDTAVSVRFEDRERLIVIESGEAEFEVTHDIKRNFRVIAGSTQIIAVGTLFDVRLAPAFTLVTVAEGRVRVALRAQANDTRELNAGQQVRVEAGKWPVHAQTVDVDRIMGWRKQKVRFDDEPLSQVASEVNRYATLPFQITAPALQTLRISGVFATNDPQAFEAFLRSLPGVKVTGTPTSILVSQE